MQTRQWSSLLLASLILALPLAPVFAQENTATLSDETISMYVGDILEVIPVHNLQNPTYTWILTQNRTFIEASRTKIFSKRPITPGSYSLYAEIASGDTHISRTFTLDLKPRLPGQEIDSPSGSGSTNAAIADTKPMIDSYGRAILPTTTQLLKIEPLNRDAVPVIADLDVAQDSDGNGNPKDDIETIDTFFQRSATPLYVWYAVPAPKRSLTLTVAMPDGAITQQIEVLDEATANDEGLTRHTDGITIGQKDGLTYTFDATINDPQSAGAPLLYHWQFGDGQESLLAHPVHTYAAEGDYTITLRVRNLYTSNDIANETQQLTVKNNGTQQSSQVTSAATSSADTQTSSTATSSRFNFDFASLGIGSLSNILMLVGVFVGSILAGVILIFLFSRMRGKGKSLSDRIEEMENTIVKKDEKAGQTIAPLTINTPQVTVKQTPPPEIAKREENKEVMKPAVQQTPKIDEKNAPSWLKTGISAAPTQQPPKQEQTPAAPKPVATPAPAPVAPKPQAPAPAPKAPEAPKPQQAQTAPATPVAPKPAPTPAPQPKPQQTQPMNSASVASNPNPNIPSWLKQPTPQAAASVPTPQPPKPVTPPAPVVPPQAPQQTPSAPVATPVQPKPATPTPAPAAPVQPQPTPVTPKPVTPPPTPEQPKPQPVAPVVPTPVVPPAAPAPAVPQAPVAPSPTPTPDTEAPIAFIRADSLQKPESTPPQANTNPPTQA